MFTGWTLPDTPDIDIFGPHELLNFTLSGPYTNGTSFNPYFTYQRYIKEVGLILLTASCRDSGFYNFTVQNMYLRQCSDSVHMQHQVDHHLITTIVDPYAKTCPE
ncbi:hypothetical protein IFM89_029472 [Coptis chinensis]|uniref:Uncharacterized protein n=1 Tax=Coptis chinensis TaxID=261450 RepID=A0A835HYT7_9MAGN|nr:hypothetical protein IFM89_029472 [Coptis chinensis]